ncbi:type II toxin-antitoxin system HicB family antitoxin [Specibacter cremeus]|uniref:type II toxin-antitoxin system HicB family antitoxin n=1 Tax=Specibacter cremeus TaxID=1629051 RepID=UPI001F0C1B09|nr:toxin-antitoxin system HicB family antitoxin [Specibacter cremeus]
MPTYETDVAIDHYAYSVSWSVEDEEFVATVAEFPSLSWLDGTQDKALRGLEALIADVVRDMQDNGEDVPTPFAEREYSGNLRVRVSPEKHRKLVIAARSRAFP